MSWTDRKQPAANRACRQIGLDRHIRAAVKAMNPWGTSRLMSNHDARTHKGCDQPAVSCARGPGTEIHDVRWWNKGSLEFEFKPKVLSRTNGP